MTNSCTYQSVIQGCGGYLPKRIITNQDLSKIVDTSDEWIVKRTGITQRHFAAADQSTSDLAVQASQIALENAGIIAQDLDLIIVGTTTPDQTFPATATIVQKKLGNSTALAFDVAGVCTGFLLALNVADNFLKLKKASYALVIGAEKMSSLLDMQDRNTCVLFGDGAGAVLLKAESSKNLKDQRGIIDIQLYSDGRFHHLLHTEGGPGTTGSIGKLRMDGQEVYRHAIIKLTGSAEKMLSKHHYTAKDIDWFIPHQANKRIIESVAHKLNLPMEKIILTVQDHANTSAASIPLALWQATLENKVKPGDLILQEAIGGGLIWGSALIRF